MRRWSRGVLGAEARDARRFLAITAAADTLGDADKRAAYDAELRTAEQSAAERSGANHGNHAGRDSLVPAERTRTRHTRNPCGMEHLRARVVVGFFGEGGGACVLPSFSSVVFDKEELALKFTASHRLARSFAIEFNLRSAARLLLVLTALLCFWQYVLQPILAPAASWLVVAESRAHRADLDAARAHARERQQAAYAARAPDSSLRVRSAARRAPHTPVVRPTSRSIPWSTPSPSHS